MSQELNQDNKELTENQKRILLKHCFGIADAALKNEDLAWSLVLNKLKDSHRLFLSAEENTQKLNKMITAALREVEPVPSETSIRIHYRINLEELMKVLSNEIEEMGTEEYYKKFPERIEKKEIIIVPVATKNLEESDEGSSEGSIESSENNECTFRGVAFFDERILKLNRGFHKIPSATLYKIQAFDPKKILELTQTFIHSLEQPLDNKAWDKPLNDELMLEKINKVIKKEHSVGNCAWITAKLFVCSIVYGIIFLSLKDLSAKDTIAHQIGLHIAEGWYKLFTADDRKRALYDYLIAHGLSVESNLLTENNRPKILKDFLNGSKDETFDRELLKIIYIKLLNWQIAEFLNEGNMAGARELLKNEENNSDFNPLLYAIRNKKLALAELLANNQKYVNAKDKSGNTALMIAADYGQLEILRILIKHRNNNQLNLHETNQEGDTVLHIAVRNNEDEIVEYLINTDPTLLNDSNHANETPLKVALNNQNTSLVKLLSSPTTTILKNQQKY